MRAHLTLVLALLTMPLAAEEQAPAPSPSPTAAALPGAGRGSANVRLEITVTARSQRGPAVTRNLNLLLRDGAGESILHTSSEASSDQAAPHPALHFEALAEARMNGERIGLKLNLDYRLWEAGSALLTGRQRVAAVLRNGERQVLAESDDPSGARRILVEARATLVP